MIPRCKVTDKARYPSKEIARGFMGVLNRRGRPVCATYWCVHCSGWHLTRMDPKATERRSKEDQMLRYFELRKENRS